MSQAFEFYDARANEAAEQADAATLDNVREKFLSAEKTWRDLADQARRTMIGREKKIQEQAALKAAQEVAASTL